MDYPKRELNFILSNTPSSIDTISETVPEISFRQGNANEAEKGNAFDDAQLESIPEEQEHKPRLSEWTRNLPPDSSPYKTIRRPKVLNKPVAGPATRRASNSQSEVRSQTESQNKDVHDRVLAETLQNPGSSLSGLQRSQSVQPRAVPFGQPMSSEGIWGEEYATHFDDAGNIEPNPSRTQRASESADRLTFNGPVHRGSSISLVPSLSADTQQNDSELSEEYANQLSQNDTGVEPSVKEANLQTRKKVIDARALRIGRYEEPEKPGPEGPGSENPAEKGTVLGGNRSRRKRPKKKSKKIKLGY